MTRTTIMLPSKLKARVLRFARLQGISMGQLIRESLEQKLLVEEDVAEDPFFADHFVAKGSGPTDVAVNHDDYLSEVMNEKLNSGKRLAGKTKSKWTAEPALMFIDTGAFFARYRIDDDEHQMAKQGWKKIAQARRPCITTDLVVAETITLLSRDFGSRLASERARTIYASNLIKIARPDEQDELQAIELMEKYAGQRIHFVDCVSFVMMRRHKLKTVFGFDRHFKVAGFALWPRR